MKTNQFITLALSTVILAGSAIADPSEVVRPANVFTPKGFDSNDNAQVILSGSLSNFCQKIAPVKTKVDYQNHKIYLDNFIYANTNCPSNQLMFVPYTSVVDLGNIPEGTYEVFVKDQNGKYESRATLPIADAIVQTSSDELLYASVDEISFRYRDGVLWPELVLKGIYTQSCLSLKSVVVHVKEGNVVEVLPITAQENKDCSFVAKPIRKVVSLPNFPKGDTLIHVRTMNGRALNKVVTSLDRSVRW